jgi:hypothetical protein
MHPGCRTLQLEATSATHQPKLGKVRYLTVTSNSFPSFRTYILFPDRRRGRLAWLERQIPAQNLEVITVLSDGQVPEFTRVEI